MLILASASPRRQELLRNAGIAHLVRPANVLEEFLPGESPEACVERLGADTVVAVDNELLGKPVNQADAARMLRLLSGREHRVITGICLIGSLRGEDVRHEITRVTVSPLTEHEIAFYLATGEPMDKAGAYAIQGQASRWIPRIEGCYFNVVGLPIALVYRMLNAQ